MCQKPALRLISLATAVRFLARWSKFLPPRNLVLILTG
jgi:hypothetical protein